MGYVTDIDVIDNEDRKKLNELLTRELLEIKGDNLEVIFVFNNYELSVTAQDKEGCANVFWEVHKR